MWDRCEGLERVSDKKKKDVQRVAITAPDSQKMRNIKMNCPLNNRITFLIYSVSVLLDCLPIVEFWK